MNLSFGQIRTSQNPRGNTATVDMARADFFEAQTAHGSEPLAQ